MKYFVFCVGMSTFFLSYSMDPGFSDASKNNIYELAQVYVAYNYLRASSTPPCLPHSQLKNEIEKCAKDMELVIRGPVTEQDKQECYAIIHESMKKDGSMQQLLAWERDENKRKKISRIR